MNPDGIHVYLISGFLGSGKTTLLNRMLKEAPPDLKLLILMNEFGEESIDGALVEDPELEMLEISRGSIFCACVKGDFIKALYRIAFVIQPQALVIEASGVANPTDIGRDLFHPVYKGTFASLEKFCLIDTANFLEQYEIFTAIEKQIEAADNFILNKMDEIDRETAERVKETILKHNPNASFVECTYAQVDVAGVFRTALRASPAIEETSKEDELLTNDELENVVDRILDDEAGQVAPPDRLISFVCRWIPGKIDGFRRIADNLPSDIVRAKGFLFENGQSYLYSHVGHKYEIVPFESPRLLNKAMNRVVFIRHEFNEDDVRSMFADQGIELL
ncbi:MAG: GTP-binding protein [Desulfomonile tiedjei]|uniref:GTP-binding protein n=1 Tax=Desulfomonile tiedjei TaxID=2358 RepID=A0A9D6V850_9BACT|nr:GTP-binding protein [Desulfomonile tiedjei]